MTTPKAESNSDLS